MAVMRAAKALRLKTVVAVDKEINPVCFYRFTNESI
jgi:hypothetical protein